MTSSGRLRAAPLDFSTLGHRYHTARGLAAATAMGMFGGLRLLWDWDPASVIVLLAVPIVIHALWQRRRSKQPLWFLFLDTTVVAIALAAIAPPTMVAVPGVVTFIVAGVLFLESRMAAAFAGYTLVVTLGALAWANTTGQVDWTPVESIVLTFVALLTWLPLVGFLLKATTLGLQQRGELEARLEQHEQRHRMIVEAASDAIVVVDGKGIIVFANPALGRIFGYPVEEVVGRPLTDLMPERYRQTHLSGLTRYLATGRRHMDWQGLELTGLRSDGQEVTLEVSFSEFVDTGGHHFIGVMRDVSQRKEIERAIEESEARYRRLFETVPVGIYGTSAKGEIVTANPAMARLLGFETPGELLGRFAQEFYFDPSDREQWKAALDEGSSESAAELRLVRADGEVIWVRDTGRPLEDDEGRIGGFEGTIEDITERKRAQERLEALVVEQQKRLEFEKALSACSTALLTESGEQALDEALRALMEATEVTSIFVERNVDDPDLGLCSSMVYEIDRLEDEIDRERWQKVPWSMMPAAYERLSRGEPFAFLVEDLRGDERALYEGTPSRSELDMPIFVGSSWAGLIGFGCVTRRAWSPAEIDLLRPAAEMFGAFWERQWAQERLEQLIRSKDEFVASVSHELRTPLTAVLGLAEELTNADVSSFEIGEMSEFHRLIAEQAREVAYIVEDLLIAARVDIGAVSVHPVPTDLREEVEKVVEGWVTGFGEVEVEGEPAKAVADPTRVRQIIRNLLTNAVRYGGSRVAARTAQESGHAILRICDDGPGIPEPDRDRMFSAYERLDVDRPKPGAVGLGLYVSRQLAYLMDGDLTYRYEDGESIFELTLPSV